MFKAQSSKSTNDMTVGSPLRAIIKFAIPLILGYILQQMYLIIDAAIVGRWIGVGALAAVGASSSIMRHCLLGDNPSVSCFNAYRLCYYLQLLKKQVK